MKRKDLVLIGAGGFGREVLWQLSEMNYSTNTYNIMGFIDEDLGLQGKLINGYPILGNNQWLLEYKKEICAVICVGNAKVRKAIYNIIRNNPLVSFPTIIADNVQCSELVRFGQGCIICLSSILTVNISIGDFVIANLDCTVGHDAVLDDFVTLYPSVNVSGNVHIGSCCEIGTGTNIIQGKNIGDNTIIGAGSVVVKDIPSDCTAVGAPAVPIKFHK
jgi:sugar O-acyltransferase (sialic acid O-acetyltransferase NeuD family)